jgi:hypothetical protein
VRRIRVCPQSGDKNDGRKCMGPEMGDRMEILRPVR